MGNLTIRNLPDDVHEALRVQAALHGRSMEAEARDLLTRGIQQPRRPDIAEARKRLREVLGDDRSGLSADDLIASRRAEAQREAEGE